MLISLNEINLPLIDEIQSSYKFISNISSGSFGKVIKAIKLSTNEEVAIKIIKKNTYNSSLKEEIKILKNCEHKNILKFIDYIETNSKFFIIMELLKGGTLKNFILNNKNLSEEKISIIIKQILSAVNYLHNKNICHRDIKPENIMFKDNSYSELKLIDFGLSIKNFYDLGEKDYCGTFRYMAPEILENKIYNKKIDLFSVGIILYELISNGVHPFINENNNVFDSENNNKKKINIKKYVDDIKNFNVNKINGKISKNFEDFLHRLLEYEPFYRLNAHEALIHPFITRKNEDFKYNNYFEILKKKILKKKFFNVFMIFSFLNYYKKNYVKVNNNNNLFKKNNNYYIFILNNFKKKNYLINMKLKNSLIKKNSVFNNKNQINKSQSTKNILFHNNINLNINNKNIYNTNDNNIINNNNYYYYYNNINNINNCKNKRLSCNNSQKIIFNEQKNNFIINKKLFSRQKKSFFNNINNNDKSLKKYSSISTLPNLQKNLNNKYENYSNKKLKKNLSKTIINYYNNNNENVNNYNNSNNFINKNFINNNNKYLKSKILLKNINDKKHSIDNLKKISLLISLSKKNY